MTRQQEIELIERIGSKKLNDAIDALTDEINDIVDEASMNLCPDDPFSDDPDKVDPLDAVMDLVQRRVIRALRKEWKLQYRV